MNIFSFAALDACDRFHPVFWSRPLGNNEGEDVRGAFLFNPEAMHEAMMTQQYRQRARCWWRVSPVFTYPGLWPHTAEHTLLLPPPTLCFVLLLQPHSHRKLGMLSFVPCWQMKRHSDYFHTSPFSFTQSWPIMLVIPISMWSFDHTWRGLAVQGLDGVIVCSSFIYLSFNLILNVQ